MIYFFFLKLDIICWNSNLGKFANIREIEWDGIRVKEFEAVQLHFLSDIFVSVIIVKTKSPQHQV